MRDHELLIEYVRTGSGEAFTELVRRYAPMVYSTCLRMLSDSHAAEDAAQAAFLVLARKARGLSRRVNLSGWLFLTARSSALQMRRAAARRARHEREGAQMRKPEGDPAGWEAVRPRLDEALASLPRVQRDAVVLRYLEGRSATEVAETMNASLAATEKRLARALARLRERLARGGAAVGGLALAGLLTGNATVALPASLSSSIGAACLGGAAASPLVASVAKGVMKAMFWTKVKLCAAALAAVAVVGTGTGVALNAASAGEAGGDLRKEKDHAGRDWQLEDWKEGTRPYEKNLAKREAEYRKKWGENWDGPVFGNRIMTPGEWKWETVVDIPEPIASDMWLTKNEAKPHHHKRWGGMWPWPAVFAPGGGEATDLYGTATHGIVHCDLKTRKVSLVGSVREGGRKDGMNAGARMTTSFLTADIVTGRVYWVESKRRTASVLRYVEKLLPYKGKASGKEYLLPAFLDYKDQYKRVKGSGGEELEPVMRDGKRVEPSFAVRTTKLKNVRLPGKTPRPLITPDGKAVWLTTKQTWPRRLVVEFENAHLFDIETGNIVSTLKLANRFPDEKQITDGVGSHGGTCTGIDGKIYVCQHTGCGGGPMRLISVDPAEGKLTYLYDSVLGVNMKKRRSDQWDGPADAQTITATSTLWQFQCPRTGAIINGGWDNTGIRRYLDGFVTSVVNGKQGHFIGRPEWKADKDKPYFGHHNCEPAIAPNGDLYLADPQSKTQRFVRIYRTDWPKEQPAYGYGEKFMPKAKLEELMLEYAKKYIANYAKLSKIY